MAQAVYLLCCATSAMCAVLLLRACRRGRAKLLFWSGLCFAGLALNNIMLFIDLVVVPDFDLSAVRSGVALAAMAVLLFGLIWEEQ